MTIKNENYISIAMATYNGEKYLMEQLQSFVKQSVLPTELVRYHQNQTSLQGFNITEFYKE